MSQEHRFEEQGRLWAHAARQRMEAGTERKYTFVSASLSEIFKLPRLGSQGERVRHIFTEDIRYDPETGAIFST